MAVYVCVCRCVGVCVWGTEGVYDDVLHPHPSIHPSFIHPFIHHRHDTGMVLYCNARDTIGGGGVFCQEVRLLVLRHCHFYFYFVLALAACGPEEKKREALVICIL